MTSGAASRAEPPAAASPFAVLGLALFAVLLWAATPVVTKVAVGAADPLAVGVLRTLIAALAALPLIVLSRLTPPRSLAGRGQLAVSALCGFVGFPILFALGVARTSAGHAALAIAIAPVFTGLFAALVERRLPTRRWWLGAGVALGGCLLLVDERFGLAAPGASLTGDLLVLLSCVTAAAGYVAGARAAREAGTWAVTVWGLVLGGLVLLPLVPVTLAPAALAAAGWPLWSALAYLALCSSILAYAAWYWALAQDDIGRTGLVQFSQPLIGLILAAVLLGERLTWPLLLSGAVIVAGVALAQRRRQTRGSGTAP